MPNLMQRGASWLGQQLQAAAGSVVSISQAGATVADDITAVRSSLLYEVPTDEGFLQQVLIHDWAFVASDISSVTMREGTRIVDEDDVEYEVLPVGKRPAVEPMDTSGLLLMVHTKKVT